MGTQKSTSSDAAECLVKIRVMPDFGGLIYQILETPRPDQVHGQESRRVEKLIPQSLTRQLESWQSEFERYAYDDSHGGKPGLMHWTDFHRRGIELAGLLKEAVGSRARVFYEKPFEDPNCRNDEIREVLRSGLLAEASRTDIK